MADNTLPYERRRTYTFMHTATCPHKYPRTHTRTHIRTHPHTRPGGAGQAGITAEMGGRLRRCRRSPDKQLGRIIALSARDLIPADRAGWTRLCALAGASHAR